MNKACPVEIPWNILESHIRQGLKDEKLNSKIHNYQFQLLEDKSPIPYQIDKLSLNYSDFDQFVFRTEVSSNSEKKYELCGLRKSGRNPIRRKSGEKYQDLVCDRQFWPLRLAEIKREVNTKEFRLRNDLLQIYFHLQKDPLGRSGFSAGSASYVGVDNRPHIAIEVLNPHNRLLEKKACQLRQIYYALPKTENASLLLDTSNTDWEFVNMNHGPIRASLAIRFPFKFNAECISQKLECEYECAVYRFLILYPDKYYLIEKVKTQVEETKTPKLYGQGYEVSKKRYDLKFKAHYSVSADFGSSTHFSNGINTDWICVGDQDGPFGYGFASSGGETASLVPGHGSSGHVEIETVLQPSLDVKCLHKFLCFLNLSNWFDPSEGKTKYRFDYNIQDEWWDCICVDVDYRLGKLEKSE